MSRKSWKGSQDNRNSMLYWFPILEKTGLPQPKTLVVKLTKKEAAQFVAALEDGAPPFPAIKRCRVAASNIGFPVFVRTDHLSGKHEWSETCYVPNEKTLPNHLLRLVEASLIADVLGLDINAFIFRKYIPLESSFTAYRGMPVACERRYFVKNGEVQCAHEYWFEDAVRQGVFRTTRLTSDGDVEYALAPGVPENWETLLRKLNKQTPNEVACLTMLAEKAGRALGGDYWSIDFAKSKTGEWLLIDAALGSASYHHPKCEYAVFPGTKND